RNCCILKLSFSFLTDEIMASQSNDPVEGQSLLRDFRSVQDGTTMDQLEPYPGLRGTSYPGKEFILPATADGSYYHDVPASGRSAGSRTGAGGFSSSIEAVDESAFRRPGDRKSVV